jgi:hypothetical protein
VAVLVALGGGAGGAARPAAAETLNERLARYTTTFPLDVPVRDGLALAADRAAREVITRDWRQPAPCAGALYLDTHTDPKAGWAAYAALGGCGVWLNPYALEDVHWALAHGAAFERVAAAAALCRLYVHEREHNLGAADNTPGSEIMHQGHMDDWTSTPGGCQAFGWSSYRATHPARRAWRLAHSDARYEAAAHTNRQARAEHAAVGRWVRDTAWTEWPPS